MQYTLIAPCYFGTESVLSYEVKKLGAADVEVSDGKVTFKGDEHIIAAANINLRTAERVVILLKEFKAKTFDELFDGVFSIDWASLMPKDAQFPVKGSSLSSTLSSVPACQKIVKKAIVESMKKGHNTKILSETGNLYKIRVALRKDVVSVMLDTSGDGLHKRGYRRNSGEAPIKETLAAAIVDLARVRSDSVIQDPFAGSGTLLIEAAQKAIMDLHITCVTYIKAISIIPPATDKLDIIEHHISAVGNQGSPMCRVIDNDSIDYDILRI